MSYMFESVDDAIEYAEALDAAIMPVDGGYRVMQESIDPGSKKLYWYAVQAERSDGWDYGSYFLAEAVEMLKAEGGTNGLIAVIDDETNTCVKEIAYDEL